MHCVSGGSSFRQSRPWPTNLNNYINDFMRLILYEFHQNFNFRVIEELGIGACKCW